MSNGGALFMENKTIDEALFQWKRIMAMPEAGWGKYIFKRLGDFCRNIDDWHDDEKWNGHMTPKIWRLDYHG